METFEVVERTATAVLAGLDLSHIADHGFPAGHNGPYRHPETPVRTTSHWAVSAAWLYRRTGERRWREVCDAAGRYLLSEHVRPRGKNVHHRDAAGKDQCNGLIGPAWTIEGFCALGTALEDTRFFAQAEEIFHLHPFDRNRGLWRIVDTDGSILGYDNTFNHQLWFATAAAHLGTHTVPSSPEIDRQVRRFLDATARTLHVYADGLIFHFVNRPVRLVGQGAPWRQRARDLAKQMKQGRSIASTDLTARQRTKWIGYHHFNMYAFGRLKTAIPEHPFWTQPELDRAATLMLTDAYKREMESPDNVYGFGYNAPGFEVPSALAVLAGMPQERVKKEYDYWMTRQLELTYDKTAGRFSRNTADPVTLTARVYELAQGHDLMFAKPPQAGTTTR